MIGDSGPMKNVNARSSPAAAGAERFKVELRQRSWALVSLVRHVLRANTARDRNRPGSGIWLHKEGNRPTILKQRKHREVPSDAHFQQARGFLPIGRNSPT